MRAKMHKFLSAIIAFAFMLGSANAEDGRLIQTKNFTATIANGASLSGAVDLQTYRAFGVQMPASWTAANLTFQVSSDCSTYANLYDDSGTEVLVTAAASTYIVFASPAKWQGARCIKVRSGTSGTAVNQGGDRSITVVGVPY
jgi:hypothetical protein